MATTVYRYLFADLLTNQILAELPLTGVSFTQVLNAAGTFQGHIMLSDLSEAGYDLTNTTIPGRTAIYVDRNGVLVWGGILWTRQYDSATQSLTFTGREFESYFEKRLIVTQQAPYYLNYVAVDQLTIAQDLINVAQSVTGGNIGVVVGTETSGKLINRTFYPYQYKDYFSAISDMSKAGSTFGFDFNIDVQYDSTGTPTKLLRLDYPYRGKVYSASDPSALVIDFPGSPEKYTWMENGALIANTVYAVGAGSAPSNYLGYYADTTHTSSGWPLYEVTANYSDVYDTNLLNTLAQGQVQAQLNPVVNGQIALPAYVDPVLGSYRTGDQILLRFTDDRFPKTGSGFGYTVVKRITAINVQAGENSPELVTLTTADLPFVPA